MKNINNAVLRKFFNEREALNLSVIERLAGIPYQLLSRFARGRVEFFPEKHWENLQKVIKVYGWQE